MSGGGAVAPHGNAPCPGLVDEVLGDARAREGDDADRHHLEHRVVALEWSGLLVAGPVGLEDDLLDAAVVGPFDGEQLGAARGAAVQQDHAGMLGLDLVKGGPDAVMVMIVDASGDESGRTQLSTPLPDAHLATSICRDKTTR